MRHAIALSMILLMLGATPSTRPTSAPTFDDAPLAIKRLIEKSEAAKQQWIVDRRKEADYLAAELTAVRNGKIDPKLDSAERHDLLTGKSRYTFRSLASKRDRAVAFAGKMNAAKERVKDVPEFILSEPSDKSELKQGYVGRVTGKVIQVIDQSNVIAEIEVTTYSDRGPGIAPSFSTSHLDAWVSGIDSKGMADGDRLPDSLIVEFDGTKQFNTAIAGIRTIPLAKVLDVSKWIDLKAQKLR